MTNYLIDAIIDLLKIFGFIATGAIVIIKYFKYLEVKQAEHSLGRTKIKEFEAAGEAFKREIEKLQQSCQGHDKEIDKLKIDYSKLLDKFFEFIRLK